MKSPRWMPVGWAVLAAALYALSSPLSKLLLRRVDATMMAALLYLGAGLGMGILGLVGRQTGRRTAEARLTRSELPYCVGMVVLDIAAPILLMAGLSMTTPETASLLNNFEIVATSLIALVCFGEAISRRLWAAIGCITLSSILLTLESQSTLCFSWGAVLVLLACVCWGFENNCTRMMSSKDPLEIVVIKGFGSGSGSLAIAFFLGERLPSAGCLAAALGLGFVAYGLSIFFYVYAQRSLGAARTSAYYAVSPFIGAGLSLAIFRQMPGPAFIPALGVMALGAYLAAVPREAAQSAAALSEREPA